MAEMPKYMEALAGHPLTVEDLGDDGLEVVLTQTRRYLVAALEATILPKTHSYRLPTKEELAQYVEMSCTGYHDGKETAEIEIVVPVFQHPLKPSKGDTDRTEEIIRLSFPFPGRMAKT